METCYALLGIAPTATTDEIEEAYQRKKIEFEADAVKRQELDSAYNEAIMATFAPIRAFSAPLPPLITGKKLPPLTQPNSSVTQAAFPSAYTSPYTGVSVDQSLQEFVEEAPVSFTDAELMKMDVSELRMSQLQDEGYETEVPFLGIEDKLLRYYVKTYIVMIVFDMLMRLLVGPGWLTVTEAIGPDQIQPTPRLLSAAFAFVSLIYCFVCALPMPFATRFFILGQPPDKNFIMWSLFYLAVMSAFLLRRLTWRFLPLNITGSAISFTFAAIALCLGTLRHRGD